MEEFQTAVRNRIYSTGGRDTWGERVAKGQSCVDASNDRAREITAVVKSMQLRGRFGLLGARVGRISGWNPLAIVPEATRKAYLGETASGSMHTYNVLELYDGNGNTYYTLDVDNYLGPIYISNHGPVNWNADHAALVEDVPPIIRSTQLYYPPSTVINSPVQFTVAVDAQPWIRAHLKVEWMYVGGVQILGGGETLRFTPNFLRPYNLRAIIYHDYTGEKVVMVETTGTMQVLPGGRSYTSQPRTTTPARPQIPVPGGPSLPTSSSPVSPPTAPGAPADIYDLFKKAGEYMRQ
jgi:hypothetical protein